LPKLSEIVRLYGLTAKEKIISKLYIWYEYY